RHTAGGPASVVERVREVSQIGEVFRVVIEAEVVRKSPDDDGWVIPVAIDHFANLLFDIFDVSVGKSLAFSGFGTVAGRRIQIDFDVRNFFPDEDAETIAYR